MTDETKEDEVFTASFSDEALEMAFSLRENTREWNQLPLRLYLDGKGCDGFYYGLSFDKKEEGDLHCEFDSTDSSKEKLLLVTDEKTLEFVNQSHITWSEHEGQKGFLVENPKHKRFRGKFYLRGFWKKKLEAVS